MSILMRELLNVTEQAPEPPTASPVPAPVQPSAAPTPNEPPPGPVPADTAPTPTDPSEYDFTRDFRAFEDTKNQAEAAAKKKLLDKMNKMMLNKKVIANASRGYGQPKTDYTIENVKKVSVEFWYKDWVVIVSDENDKKFFLTPGVNVKIESPTTAVEPEIPMGEPQADQAPQEPPKAPEPTPEPAAPPAPESPAPEAPPAPESPAPEAPPAPEPEVPEVPAAPETPAPEQPAAPAPAPAAPAAPAAPQVPPKKKKKKLPMAEKVEKLLNQFMVNQYRVDLTNLTEQIQGKNNFCIEIPAAYFESFDTRNFLLEAKELTRSYEQHGLKSSVDVQRIGRMYRFTFQVGE